MTTLTDLDHRICDRTILVTGGAGFIGSHIADALAVQNDVRILDNFSAGKEQNLPADTTLIRGDLGNNEVLESAMNDVDIVFHKAALISVARSIREPITTTRINVESTVRLLEHARQADARVVFASSAAVYGQPDHIPISESHQTRPTSPYGISKLSAEQYLRVYAERYGLPTISLRYFNVYGPRQTGGDYSGVISVFMDQACDGKPLTVHGNGEQTRDFIHVYDVVKANMLAATSDTTGIAYNVGTGQSVTIAELANYVKNVTGSDSRIEYGEPRVSDIKQSCADTTAIQNELGFESTITLEEGLSSLPQLQPAERTVR